MGILQTQERKKGMSLAPSPFHSPEREINEIHQISFLVEIRFPRSVCIEAASRAHTHIPPPRWGMAGPGRCQHWQYPVFPRGRGIKYLPRRNKRESCGGVSLAARPAISRGIRRDKPGPAFRTPLGPIHTEGTANISSSAFFLLPPSLLFSFSNRKISEARANPNPDSVVTAWFFVVSLLIEEKRWFCWLFVGRVKLLVVNLFNFFKKEAERYERDLPYHRRKKGFDSALKKERAESGFGRSWTSYHVALVGIGGDRFIYTGAPL